MSLHRTSFATPSPMLIAILDTPAYLQHPDLKNNIIGGYDFTTNMPLPNEDTPSFFHGTHIAGIIGGDGAIQGVFPDAQLLYYVVDTNEPDSLNDNITKAIYRSIQEGATIINLSGKIGYDRSDPQIINAVNFATTHNTIFVKSCGNTGPDLWSTQGLATAPNVLSIGAYDTETSTLYEHSSYGPAFGSGRIKPDFIAPGVNIKSTATPLLGNYTSASGTSMAAAYTSGALGLIQSQRPQLSGQLLSCAMANNAIPLKDASGIPYPVVAQGSGALNIPNTLATDIVCIPHQLSFIHTDPLQIPLSHTQMLTLNNTSGHPVTYYLNFESEVVPIPFGIDFPNTVTINAFSSIEIPLTINIPTHAPAGYYGGRLYLSNASSTKNIPVLVEITPPDFPLTRGFSITEDLHSFKKSNDFMFVVEAALPLNELTIDAVNLSTEQHYVLINHHSTSSGILEIGWDGYDLDNTLLPDGMYELFLTSRSGSYKTIMRDLVLVIDNTNPTLRAIHCSALPSGELTIDLTLEDFIIDYDYVIDIIYKYSDTPPPSIKLYYSLDGKDYTQLALAEQQSNITFTIPDTASTLYITMIDLAGNSTTNQFNLSPFQQLR